MLALLLPSLAILSMVNTASITDDGGTLSLLDTVNAEPAAAIKDMIENPPGHTYIKPD